MSRANIISRLRTPPIGFPRRRGLLRVRAERVPLQLLREAGLPVGALTNGNCDVRLHPEVSALFDFAVGAVDAGAAKPEVAPFWFAAAAAECSPAELVHVGDDVTSDLLGALRAGARAILLSRPEQQPRKPHEVEALAAIEADATRWREVSSLAEAVQVIGDKVLKAWLLQTCRQKPAATNRNTVRQY